MAWKKHPFSSELPQALKGSIVDENRGGALLTMLRHEDAPVFLADVDAPQLAARAFNCFWYSGLFDRARGLLEDSPGLRRAVGLRRCLIPGDEILGPPEYDDDPISAFASSEAAARWDLWGVSKTARELWNSVSRVANDTREPMRILNVGLSGLSGTEKDKVAKVIHGLANRASFAVLGPEDDDPRSALEGTISGGTLYLRVGDSLQDNVRSTVYGAFTSRVYEEVLVDALLIVDSPSTRVVGYGSGKMLGAGEGFSGTLGRNVPGQWSFLSIPDLRKRTADVPLLVNKALEHLQADDLADIRHHLACWLVEQIMHSEVDLEVGWLERALSEVCVALRPDWSPIDSQPDHHTQSLTEERSGPNVAEDNEFAHSDDYSSVRSHGRDYQLRGRAVELIRMLHQASKTVHPWVSRDHLEIELNHDSKKPPLRVRDVFAKPEIYKALVESDGKGRYRLRK